MGSFQIANEPWGYVVEAHWQDEDGVYRWHPLRNFGDRQGDALDFCHHDCPSYEPAVIKTLIGRYDWKVKYVRLDGNHFYKQH